MQLWNLTHPAYMVEHGGVVVRAISSKPPRFVIENDMNLSIDLSILLAWFSNAQQLVTKQTPPGAAELIDRLHLI